MFKRKIFTLTAGAVISFIILGGVQFFLLYNTYKLKNEHYAMTHKGAIEQVYGRSIINDKLFPGGAAIIDRYLNRYMDTLEKTAAHDSMAFNNLRYAIGDTIIRALRPKNTLDSVFSTMIRNTGLQYALFVSELDINFTPFHFHPLLDQSTMSGWGIKIGGTLQAPILSNRVSQLTVASGSDHSYRIRFSLFADNTERRLSIINSMMPTFLLSLLSILFVMTISYLAFRNWIKQKKLSEMKSDFINSITHEFNTPLATIIIANKTLQNNRLTTNMDQIPPLAGVIQRQTDRLQTMVDRVLDITTINTVIPEKRQLHLHEILEEITQDYRLKHNTEATIHLIKNTPSDTIIADPFWLTTIILNILDNAIKYNDSAKKNVTLSTRSTRKYLQLEIRDNGFGMDADTKAHIFEKFYRAPDQVKKESKGLGLGLFYVWMAVQAHQWKIEVASYPGQGSTFVISIPNGNGSHA